MPRPRRAIRVASACDDEVDCGGVEMGNVPVGLARKKTLRDRLPSRRLATMKTTRRAFHKLDQDTDTGVKASNSRTRQQPWKLYTRQIEVADAEDEAATLPSGSAASVAIAPSVGWHVSACPQVRLVKRTMGLQGRLKHATPKKDAIDRKRLGLALGLERKVMTRGVDEALRQGCECKLKIATCKLKIVAYIFLFFLIGVGTPYAMRSSVWTWLNRRHSLRASSRTLQPILPPPALPLAPPIFVYVPYSQDPPSSPSPAAQVSPSPSPPRVPHSPTPSPPSAPPAIPLVAPQQRATTRRDEMTRPCHSCSSGSAVWSVGAVSVDLSSTTMTSSATEHRSHALIHSPISERSSEVQVPRDPGVVQRVRQYLSSVYPTGRSTSFNSTSAAGVSSDDLLHLFRSLVHVYQGVANIDVPLDALEPSVFGLGSDASSTIQCVRGAAEDVVPFRAIMSRSQQLTYRELLPCRRGIECVHALNHFAPDWLDGVEAADAYFEVRHFAHVTWWGYSQQPDSWVAFEDDVSNTHGSGWWYLHSPGSGVFYHAGRTMVAPTKIAMFARLLGQWLSAGRSISDTALLGDLRHTAGTQDLHFFLARLISVRDGAMTCREAGVQHCYDTAVRDEYQESWTLYDAPYDSLSLRLGRALGYETLFFSASFLRPDLLRGDSADSRTVSALKNGAELVDLRRPGWASRTDNNGTSDAWMAASERVRADSWAADVRQRGTLSLRDPFDPVHGPSLPCEFAVTRHLACRGHASWEFRDTRPSQLPCNIPEAIPFWPGTICDEWCNAHTAPWASKCGFARCGGCRAGCERAIASQPMSRSL